MAAGLTLPAGFSGETLENGAISLVVTVSDPDGRRAGERRHFASCRFGTQCVASMSARRKAL